MDAPELSRSSLRATMLAGMVAVGLALAVGELVAGLVPRVTSPVVAVGTAVIESAPGWLERVAIDVFGTANKLALNVGIVVISMVIGAVVALMAQRRPWVGEAGFVLFGLVGVLALVRSTAAPIAGTLTVVAGAVVAGAVVLRSLLAAVPAPHDPSRRRFVVLIAGAGAAAVLSAGAGRMLLQRAVPLTFAVPPPAEPAVAPPADLPVTDISPYVTPNEHFFRIDTNLVVPAVDPAGWRLRVHGLVDREVVLSLDDLLAMPLVERWVTLVCVSNPVGGDLVGNAAWTGVPLRGLLDRAGVRPAATQIVGRSVDGWTAGFQTELAFDGRDALVAVGMNGEPLPRRHGAPARLVVSGLYGYVSATKWLEEIELTTWEAYDAFWVRRDWAKEGPVKIQSRIDVPRDGATVDAGTVDVAGVAWAPRVGVAGVEVSIDGGDWVEAGVGPSASHHAWRQWHHRWGAEPGEHRIAVRARGEDGAVQMLGRRNPFPDGAEGHHTIRVTVA